MKPVFRRSLTALPDLHLYELAAHCVDVVTDDRPGFADDEYGQLIEADCAIGAIGIGRQVCQSHTFKGVAVYIFIGKRVSVMVLNVAAYEGKVTVVGFCDEVDRI